MDEGGQLSALGGVGGRGREGGDPGHSDACGRGARAGMAEKGGHSDNTSQLDFAAGTHAAGTHQLSHSFPQSWEPASEQFVI